MTEEQIATKPRKPKLLLADDSVTIRKVVELTFADEGVDVTAVGSGEEAMQKFVEIEPDIVLVDVNMPDPTGYHICEMIKQDESTRHIPVLLLVGSFEPFDQDEAERVGADGFMVKPFQSIRELVAKVSELLGPEKEPQVVPAETTDIDNLYLNSFTETYKMDDAATSDVFLGDAGMDDEIIETVHLSGEPAERYTQPAGDGDQTLRGFDWSAAPVEEPGPAPEAGSNGGFEPRFIIDDEEPVQARDHGEDAHAKERPVELHHDNDEPVQVTDHGNDEPLEVRNDDVREPVEEKNDVGGDSAEVTKPGEEDPFERTLDDEFEVDTLRDMEVESPTADPRAEAEPSDEFITKVARLVVEKLSDRVIREIARDAVPRIAENLIREALDEENKG